MKSLCSEVVEDVVLNLCCDYCEDHSVQLLKMTRQLLSGHFSFIRVCSETVYFTNVCYKQVNLGISSYKNHNSFAGNERKGWYMIMVIWRQYLVPEAQAAKVTYGKQNTKNILLFMKPTTREQGQMQMPTLVYNIWAILVRQAGI